MRIALRRLDVRVIRQPYSNGLQDCMPIPQSEEEIQVPELELYELESGTRLGQREVGPRHTMLQ